MSVSYSNGGEAFGGSFSGPPQLDAPFIPPIPVAMLSTIGGMPKKARMKAARKMAEAEFDCFNRPTLEQLSCLPLVASEVREWFLLYELLLDKLGLTDQVVRVSADHPERRPTKFQQWVFVALAAMFCASLLAVSAATVNYVLNANIYPSLGGNWFLAGMATVIPLTVLVGGPLCIYETLTTDSERRQFASRTAKSGLCFGFVWLGLLGIVVGLDNFNVVTLTAHPFRVEQKYLNWLFPALENTALCLMAIVQILGESMGAVALELRTIRKRDHFRKFSNEPNACHEDLKDRVAAAREVALKLALQHERLTQQQALLDKGRDVFGTICTAWLEAQLRRQRGACFSCLATGVKAMFKFVVTLMLCMILSGAARARTFVLAIPANLSPELTDTAEDVVAGVVAGLQPGDTFVGVDASHLTIIARVTAPANLGGDAKARARVFGEAEGKINDLIEEPDKTAALDDLDIPVLLRELGRNVLPELPDKDVHILLIGSVIWQSKDTNWTFREYVPSDGFLVKPVGDFGVTGQETILSGSLTSICYTNKIGSFAWEGFRREILAFWGKSIAGRGGKVGSLQSFAPDCVARFFSPVEDKTPYVINRGEDVFLRKMHWRIVDVR